MAHTCSWLLRTGLLAALALAATAATRADARAEAGKSPATILLIRHGEKPPVGSHLSMLGVERAKALPQLFGGDAVAPPHNLPRPAFLFAAQAKRKSNRPVETLIPLSDALHVPIDSRFMDDNPKGLAKLLLGGKFAGAVVLVSWRHDNLPVLAEALGAKPPYDKWPDQQYDRVWRIDFKDGRAVLTDLPQALLPGDAR